MIPWAMNRELNFIRGVGPTLKPMVPNETKILKNINISQKLEPLKTSISILRKELPQSKSLIGFAGAPWTLACYMIEGQSSKDFINTRKALWDSNKWFMELIDTLSIYVAEKLEMQANAGADVLMLFDSWSHMIPSNFFRKCAIDPTANIISMLKSKNVTKPIIGLPFKAGSSLIDYSYESNVNCIALDWTVNLNWAIKNLNSSIAIQGNLDPKILLESKDVILQIIGKIGTAGGTGYVIEYAGDVISSLTVENRMTICNMTIEGGARAGLIAPDEKIFKYLKGKPMAPKNDIWDKALEYWGKLNSDNDAEFDKEVSLKGEEIKPMVTWGTSPQDVITIDGKVPNPTDEKDNDRRSSIERSLKYMGLKPNTLIKDIKIDKVFIGSCTNGRIEDLRDAAKILKNKKIASHVQAMVVPGSGLVKEQAEQEGLDKIFLNSGFEWREPGCSMCLAMNADKLKPEERCASTSNRNFEGRQGRGGRTHLVSPAMAAAAAISGNFEDVRKYKN